MAKYGSDCETKILQRWKWPHTGRFELPTAQNCPSRADITLGYGFLQYKHKMQQWIISYLDLITASPFLNLAV